MDQDQTAGDGSLVWIPGVVANVLRFALANEIACTWRRINKSTSQQFEVFTVVLLSLASPAHEFQRRWGNPGACRDLTRKQRWSLLRLTAVSGSIENLEVALGSAGLVLTAGLLTAAAEAGQLEACKLLRVRGCPWGDALLSAARGGHRHVCEWLLASGCPLTRGAVYASASGGHEDLMLWLLQLLRKRNGARDVETAELLQSAAEGLALAAFQRLHQQQLRLGQQQQRQAGQQQQQQQQQQPQGGAGVEEQPQQPLLVLDEDEQGWVLAAAAGSPSPDWQAKVEWLEGLGYPRTANACSNAASRGPGGDAVGRLRWLHARGYPMCVSVAADAADQGDLAALRFLVEEAGVQPGGYQVTTSERGHLAVLQYLHSRGSIPVVSFVVYNAAEGGHLPVVAWAVDALGVTPANARDLLDYAARSGSVELMAWLRERGWDWSSNAISSAASSGCEEALEWLVERGCPCPANSQPFSLAAGRGDLAMIRCLHRLGCPWGPDQLVQCIRGCLGPPAPVPALRLLVELGCPVDWQAVQEEAEACPPWKNHAALLDWLAGSGSGGSRRAPS